MSTTVGCGDGQALRQFVLGQMAETEAMDLEHHLDGCPRCVETLQQLRVDDTLFDAVRHAAAEAGAKPPSATIAALVEEASRLFKADAAAEDLMQQVADFLAPPEAPGEIGRLGPYRLLKVLGTGGMGIVFHAEDTTLKRPVALKVMKPALASNASARRRFLRESQAAASVKHDHVVTILQVGIDHELPFLAMELLEGESLQERLHRDNRLPVPELIRIGREIAQGLAAIHQRGLIHRDIEPSNIWLESCPTMADFRVKILDFGIARAEGEEGILTWTDQIVGTPTYIAPEQARGEKVDQRCDLFNLGCVLYRMGTGRLPFKGDTTMAQLTSLAMDPPEPIDKLAPDLPQPLAGLILRLLSKDPAGRPASAAAVVDALAETERMWGQVSNLPADRLETCRHEFPTRSSGAWRLGLALAASLLLLAGSWQVAQVIIRIRYPDGTEKDIPAPPGTTAKVIEDPAKAKAKPNPFDAFQRDQLTNEELAAVGGGDAKNAPAELVGILGDGRDNSAVMPLALHPDGKHLVWGDEAGTVRVWDLVTRKEVAAFPGERAAGSLSFSADGGRLATNVWKSGPAVFEAAVAPLLLKRPVRHFKGYESRSIALSPDGKSLAAGGWEKVTLLDVDSGKELMTLEHGKRIDRVAYSSDGARLASASTDGTAKVWDARTGRNLHTLQGAGGPLQSIAFSPDGTRLAAAGRGGEFKIWDAATGQEIVTCTCPGGPTTVTALSFNADGSLVAGGDFRQGVTIWNSHSAQIVNHWKVQHRVWSVLFAPDGRHLLVGDQTGKVYVLRLSKA